MRIFKTAAYAVMLLTTVGELKADMVTLEGMGLIKQWTDLENQTGEIPGFIWGDSDSLGADRIGLHVKFASGIEGSVTYRGVSALWNTTFPGLAADTATGFFTNPNGGLHFLFNSDVGGQLPMAWDSLSMPFSSNFDLDYADTSSDFGSHFRATVPGWESAVFSTFSSAYAVPEPSSIAAMLSLIGFGAGAVVLRRRRAKKLAAHCGLFAA